MLQYITQTLSFSDAQVHGRLYTVNMNSKQSSLSSVMKFNKWQLEFNTHQESRLLFSLPLCFQTGFSAPQSPNQRVPGSVPGNKPTEIFLVFVGLLQFHNRNIQNTILEHNCYSKLWYDRSKITQRTQIITVRCSQVSYSMNLFTRETMNKCA